MNTRKDYKLAVCKIENKELNAKIKDIKEKMINLSEIKRDVEDFTMERLQQHCKNNGDDPDRVIARASEILIGRHSYELNLIITQLSELYKSDYSEETEYKIIEDFNKEWVKRGLEIY